MLGKYEKNKSENSEEASDAKVASASIGGQGQKCRHEKGKKAKAGMRGYVENIEKASFENENFRTVLYTAKNCQLVLMSLKPGEDIGEEVHQLDQFIRCEAGGGKAVIDGITHEIREGFAVVVPAGAKHNILNTSLDTLLKLYTVYAPPNHRDGIVHKTKEEAERDEEHFDGKTTE